ncbi:hypothetical protein [Collimonas antrihumi]|uniref:hypothetical protein n=1 Tax=Collimonas antrihumi TaxID=1940615 RepID=UPI001B8C502C|nr:hypothetical protein [Collimonas antrihumi]
MIYFAYWAGALLSAGMAVLGIYQLLLVKFNYSKYTETLEKRGQSVPSKGKTVIALLGGSLFFCLCAYGLMIAANEEHKKLPSSIQSVEDATRYFSGTWTYTSPIDPKNEYVFMWIKWVIHPDGTVERSYAHPSANDWGAEKISSYTVFFEKYSDTGERYYAMRPTDTGEIAIVMPNGNLHYSILGKGAVELKKENRFPFSK